jgi:glutamate N-acetyltransferase/amino-acid N-acetyltransferase
MNPTSRPAPAPDNLSGFRLAAGFASSGVACGLKPSGALDLALVVADRPCSAAGVFTNNLVKAAPVVFDQGALAKNSGGMRAVIANSGCANACTGEQGQRNARRMAELAANAFKCSTESVLVLSTGVIGKQLDMMKLERGIPEACARASADGASLAARAILTTDTRAKVAGANLALGSSHATIQGFAKGSGMIHPWMATMLAVITTDAAVSPELLKNALLRAVSKSFNRLSVDGDMSTNDTVLLLASGASGAKVEGAHLDRFVEALTGVCVSLTKQIARDGEGASKLIEVIVVGAPDEANAHRAADAIACSPLVKTAIHGNDPNWGRILAAAGYSGATFDPDRVGLWFGDGASAIQLVRAGQPIPFDARAASDILRRDPVQVRLDFGLGHGQATVWTCDLSAAYIQINADYTT